MIGALLLAMAVPVIIYDCRIDPPKSLERNGAKVTLTPVVFSQFGNSDWAFTINVRQSDNEKKAELVWPRDPFQVAGSYSLISTSAGSFAFTVSKGNGCLFTEQGCVTTVHVVSDKAGAKIVIMPTALTSNGDVTTREPFTVIIEGRCTRKDTK